MWTGEQIEEVKKLWFDGFSAREIATKVGGLTRSAVLGKLTRLGYAGSAKDPDMQPRVVRRTSKPKVERPQRAYQRRAKTMAVKNPNVLALIRAEQVQPTGEPVEYLQLESHHCRALLARRGSDGLLLSCGATRLRCSSYCPTHDREYQPGRYTH